MKPSVKNIFKNLNILLMFTLTLSVLLSFFLWEQYNSYSKVQLLQNHKAMLPILIAENKHDFNQIQYNASLSKIQRENEEMIEKFELNYIRNYIIKDSREFIKKMQTLESLIDQVDENFRLFQEYKTKNSTIALELENKLALTLKNIVNLINDITIKNIADDEKVFFFFIAIFTLLFVTLLIATLWYKNRLYNVYKDLHNLLATDGNFKAFSQEADSILLKTNRKTLTADHPSMIDPITEIYNNKGLTQAYSERKVKENNFSSLVILEIDNFSKSKRTYSQEFTQTILKKVSYAISLHQQATDLIARVDYNQFTLLFSRSSKEQLFKDADLVRQSISEIKLLDPDKQPLQITVTGAFIQKSNYGPLEESLKKAKDLLEKGRKLGRDRIIQLKDLPK